jgi:putative colanic acid biosynthesis UDP-glucose lipid carrier transferase
MSVLRPYSAVFGALLRGLDGFFIGLVLFLITHELDQVWSAMQGYAALAAIAIFVVVAQTLRLYESRRLQTLDDEFRGVMIVWMTTCTALIVMAFVLKLSSNYSRLATISWFMMTPAVLIFMRLGVRLVLGYVRSHGGNTRTLAIAGSSQLADGIVKKLGSSATFGIRVLGVFDDRAAERLLKDGQDPARRVGSLNELVERARRGECDYVFIALPMRAEKRIVELVNRLADTTASVYVVPDLFMFDLMRARLTVLGGMPAVSVFESPFDGLNGLLKRAEDLVLGLVFLAVAAIPMTIIAAAIKLTSGGPVFFAQRRYGLNGKLVHVLKYRTMTSADDGASVPQARADDPRITRLGGFLRRSSLDELPQLLHVITGEMSLVGPRPHAIAHNEEYRGLIHGYMLRHKVKPGITGWAQVNGWRGETDTLDKMRGRVQHDLEYVQNWSLWLDLRILARTVRAVFARTNAV